MHRKKIAPRRDTHITHFVHRNIATEEIEGVIEKFRHYTHPWPWPTEHDIRVALDVLYTRMLPDIKAAYPVTRYTIHNTSLSTDKGITGSVLYIASMQSPHKAYQKRHRPRHTTRG